MALAFTGHGSRWSGWYALVSPSKRMGGRFRWWGREGLEGKEREEGLGRGGERRDRAGSSDDIQR